MYGQGSIWASFFFVLAGFFCTYPMKPNGEERLDTPLKLLLFYLQKIARIMPIYWICCLFFYWIDGGQTGKRDLIRSMFLIQTSGHNWYVQHLMVGYLVTGIIILLVSFLKSRLHVKNWMIGVFLLVVSVIFNYWLLNKSPWYLLWNLNSRHFIPRIMSGQVPP